MNKRITWNWIKFLGFKKSGNIKATSLVELMISIIVVSVMVLSFQSLETFGHNQVVSADRRAKVQNDLAYCLEHMAKYVKQAAGNGNLNANYPAILLYPTAAGAKTGFQVRVDLNDPQTPSNFSDDALVYYTLAGNALSTGCTPQGTGTCGSFSAETLSTKIVANFNNGILPLIPLYSSSDGFYVSIDASGNFVDIGLVGRYYPTKVPTAASKLTNPQVALKTRLICNNTSSH